MLKKIYINIKKRNFIILIGIITISILLLTGFVKILKYSYLEIFDSSAYVNLSNSIEYLIPKDNQNSDVNQVIDNYENTFMQNNYKSIHFSRDFQEVWLRLKLQGNQADIKNILYIDCEFVENIEFYIPTTDNKFVSIKPKGYFIFPYVDFPENTDFSKDIYINLAWTENDFNLLLAKDTDFYILQNWLTCFYMGNLGVIVGMIIMNMILFFSSKDNKYLFHSLFTGSLLSLLFCISGMQRLIFEFTTDNYLIALGAMVSLTWILFIYSYLDIKNNIPVLNKFFILSIIMLISSLYLSQIIPKRFTYDILYLDILITGLSVIVAVYSYFKFSIGSIYYLTAIFVLFSGIILYLLGTYGLLQWDIITFTSLYLATSIETLLFTLGIITQIKNEKDKNSKLQLEVVTDKLTNLYNRRYFEETVKDKIIDMRKSTVSMLILDIDHFKDVNDTYGHDVGDSVLIEASMLIKKCLRKEDILVRWGGEEFVAILPFTNVQEGTAVAETIKRTAENHLFKYVKKTTFSIGVAEKGANESFEDWFKRVDEAMYHAKEGGRNKVCAYSLDEVPS